MEIPDQLAFTVADTCRLLDLGRHQVYRMIRSGVIPESDLIHTAGGGQKRITRAGLFRLAKCDDPNPPQPAVASVPAPRGGAR